MVPVGLSSTLILDKLAWQIQELGQCDLQCYGHNHSPAWRQEPGRKVRLAEILQTPVSSSVRERT